jgi:hypothetical protein
VADFDADGKLDVATANYDYWAPTESTVSIVRGRGDGSFEPALTYAGIRGSQFLVAEDFNGDGFPDLAVRGDNFYYSLVGVHINAADWPAPGGLPIGDGPGSAPVSAGHLVANDRRLTTIGALNDTTAALVSSMLDPWRQPAGGGALSGTTETVTDTRASFRPMTRIPSAHDAVFATFLDLGLIA